MRDFKQLIKQRKVFSKKLKRPPKWLFPYNAEKAYTRILYSLTKEIRDQIRKVLLPLVPSLLSESQSLNPVNDSIKNDDFIDQLNALIKQIANSLKPKVDQTIRESQQIALDIASYNEKQFRKITKSVFDLDLFIDQPWLQSQLELFAQQNAQLITSIPLQELEQVSQMIQRNMQEGRRFTEVQKDLISRYGITRRRAKLIARDQTTKLNASLTKLRQQELGVTSYEWQTAGDERVRPTHRANDGKIFRWDKPPKVTGHPGSDVNCLKGKSKLFCLDVTKKMFRRRYRGKFSQIVTNSGCVIESTPNHPIYTSRGWIPFKLVQKGDYLIETSNETFNFFEMNPDNFIPTIEDCFHSMLKLFGSSTSRSTFGKFHGDIFDSEIDIIDMTSSLPCMFNAMQLKEFSKFILALSDMYVTKVGLPDFSSFQPHFKCLFGTSQRFISGFCNLLSILSGTVFKSNDISLRSIANFNSILNKPLLYRSSTNFISLRELIDASSRGVKSDYFINRQLFEIMWLSSEFISLSINPPSSHVLRNDISIDTQKFTYGSDSFSFFKKGNRVVDNRFIDFSGHVYNLETCCNYYTTIEEKCNPILHNCRCVAVPILEGVIE